MSFHVEITRKAAREIARQYDWLAERSQAWADRWRNTLLRAVGSLEENPNRCGEAPEAEWYGVGLRQLLCGKRPHVYRILFEIRDDVVVVLRVRHAAQDLLHPGEM